MDLQHSHRVLIMAASCLALVSCDSHPPPALSDLEGVAIRDDFHTGPFWDAMARAGFQRIAADSGSRRAEIWGMKQRGDVIEVGWLVENTGLVSGDVWSFEIEGTLTEAKGAIPQYGWGQRDTFTLSDRRAVYEPRIHDRLKPPDEVWILIQLFRVDAATLHGPLSISMLLRVQHSGREETYSFSASDIPVTVIEP